MHISFTTAGGTGPLTWGQYEIRSALLWFGEESHFLNVKQILAVPPGRTVQDVADAIGTLVHRHNALVTRFPRFATDPCQEVPRHGTIQLTLHAAAELASRCFDHEHEWPARFALVLVDGEPRRLVMVFSHLIFDAASLRIVLEDLGQLLGGKPLPPPDGSWSPLALAEHEQSAAGRARSAAAMRYWRSELRESPHTIFDVPMLSPENPQVRRLRMRSLALAVAASRVAKTHRCSTSAVILAAVAAVLGHYTGHARIPIWLVASNRWRPQVLRTITHLTEQGICSVTLGELSFGEFAVAAWKQALMGYQNAAYDPVDCQVELDSAQRLRGAHIERGVLFNDVRQVDGWPQAPDAALTDLCAVTSVEPIDQRNRARKIHVDVLNSADCATVDLEFNTAFLPDLVARQLLAGVEALLVRAACRPVRLDEVGAITGIAPVVRGEGWVRVHGAGWVRPVEVAHLVAAVPGVARCAVFVEPERLVAYLVATHPVTLEAVHDRVCALCVNRTDVMAPQHYVLCAEPPADDSHAAWRSQPVLRSGSGRD